MATATRPRTYHNTAMLLPDGRVLVGGHAPISTAVPVEHPRSRAPTRTPTVTRRSRSTSRRTCSAVDRPTINAAADTARLRRRRSRSQTPDPASIDSVVLMRNTAITHLVDGDQRSVMLPDRRAARRAPSSCRRAARPAVAPPGPYMLFLNKGRSTARSSRRSAKQMRWGRHRRPPPPSHRSAAAPDRRRPCRRRSRCRRSIAADADAAAGLDAATERRWPARRKSQRLRRPLARTATPLADGQRPLVVAAVAIAAVALAGAVLAPAAAAHGSDPGDPDRARRRRARAPRGRPIQVVASVSAELVAENTTADRARRAGRDRRAVPAHRSRGRARQPRLAVVVPEQQPVRRRRRPRDASPDARATAVGRVVRRAGVGMVRPPPAPRAAGRAPTPRAVRRKTTTLARLDRSRSTTAASPWSREGRVVYAPAPRRRDRAARAGRRGRSTGVAVQLAPGTGPGAASSPTRVRAGGRARRADGEPFLRIGPDGARSTATARPGSTTPAPGPGPHRRRGRRRPRGAHPTGRLVVERAELLVARVPRPVRSRDRPASTRGRRPRDGRAARVDGAASNVPAARVEVQGETIWWPAG